MIDFKRLNVFYLCFICLSMRSNSSTKFYHEVAAIQSLLQVLLLILLLFPHLQLLPLTEVFFFFN